MLNLKRNPFCFFILFLILSCEGTDCKALADSYRKPECILVVKNLPDKNSVYNFEVGGRNVNSDKDTVYKEENRWFCSLYKHISINDTIIKRKGELTFKIHKKDTILVFYWDCQGKTYK